MEALKLFGRDKEKKIIDEYFTSNQSNLIAVIGRRRIGKTYLVRRSLEHKLDFEMTGIQHGSTKDQLLGFHNCLLSQFKKMNYSRPPANWIVAFERLKECLIIHKRKKKKVIFLDEFPWINTAKSGFIEKFAHFWNSWASENNVLIIVSGSAATWMLKNVVNGKGGLHNRISQTLNLKPFHLDQVREMVSGMGIKATPTQIAELYMILGGVPYYLSLLKKSKSVPQNINDLLFGENGKLENEYQNLLPSLFDDASNHLKVLEALAKKWKGLNRQELIQLYKKADGGGLTKILDDLEQSGFITSYIPFRKLKKDTLYRISDSYTLFYLKFLKHNRHDSFMDVMKNNNYKIWMGYAFENLCLQHHRKIIAFLGLEKIKCNTSSYLFKGNQYQEGFQIDLLIERGDNIINLCEIKYYNKPFVIDKKYYLQIKSRISHFQEVIGSKFVIHFTLITSNGAVKNEYYHEVVDSELCLEGL